MKVMKNILLNSDNYDNLPSKPLIPFNSDDISSGSSYESFNSKSSFINKDQMELENIAIR